MRGEKLPKTIASTSTRKWLGIPYQARWARETPLKDPVKRTSPVGIANPEADEGLGPTPPLMKAPKRKKSAAAMEITGKNHKMSNPASR